MISWVVNSVDKSSLKTIFNLLLNSHIHSYIRFKNHFGTVTKIWTESFQSFSS